MASSPLIFEAMPPPAARRRPAQFTLPSVLNVEKRLAECPLLALFGHGAMSDLSPLSGVKRKLDFGAVRAAFDPNQTSGALNGSALEAVSQPYPSIYDVLSLAKAQTDPALLKLGC